MCLDVMLGQVSRMYLWRSSRKVSVVVAIGQLVIWRTECSDWMVREVLTAMAPMKLWVPSSVMCFVRINGCTDPKARAFTRTPIKMFLECDFSQLLLTGFPIVITEPTSAINAPLPTFGVVLLDVFLVRVLPSRSTQDCHTIIL